MGSVCPAFIGKAALSLFITSMAELLPELAPDIASLEGGFHVEKAECLDGKEGKVLRAFDDILLRLSLS